MAGHPTRPCRAPGCGKLVHDGTGFCEAHADQSSGWNAPGRGTAAQRGYGTEWRRIRARIMKRDRGICQTCLRNDGVVRPGGEVDHIVPKFQGGTDDPSNLECICRPCHKAKTAKENQQARGAAL